MQINASLSSHTLALFGATSERSDNPLLSLDTSGAKNTDPTKYTVATSPQAAADLQTEPTSQDSASAYRPSVDPDFLNSTYTDPRLSGTYDNVAPVAYDGPSYSERAGGDGLLNTVMADLEAIKNNQLAAMKEEFQARVEATIGRKLTEYEDVYDFHTQAIISNEDWSLGMDTRGLEGVVGRATRNGEYEVKSGMTLENRTEEQRVEEFLQRRTRGTLQSITASIRNANQAINNGFGDSEDRRPTFSEEETAILTQEIYQNLKEAFDDGRLIVTFS